ncbi:hypothetical protein BO99DRAFT_268774 [Aspergillus violaceofuscus CBS 115571]|uniref:Uncharacterized protein n=1 Tax=Aspergillus violaceofuscus (strain CBS 115571) TaxID=1450538 RepID=A0A2V5HSX1_ASPV1|nr:hypothetical protein BO99DRAFT_268774 [Aspergillus violaceofuscus CBS 115571]
MLTVSELSAPPNLRFLHMCGRSPYAASDRFRRLRDSPATQPSGIYDVQCICLEEPCPSRVFRSAKKKKKKKKKKVKKKRKSSEKQKSPSSRLAYLYVHWAVHPRSRANSFARVGKNFRKRGMPLVHPHKLQLL